MSRWLARCSDDDRRQVTLLLLSMALYLFHVTWFSTWQIEDAAITYAYARNFANGDGFVTNVGGEWVEGFSNPTWTLLMALAVALGIDPFAAGKLAGAAFGLASLPLAWLWARRLQPEQGGLWPALAPLALALSTQHALWSVSGLENGLLSLLMAAGAVLILREGDRPAWGWSGIPLGLLAFTRPEAPLYATLVVLVGGPAALRRNGVRWLGSFLALSAVPFFTWHAWRYSRFGWAFPNTYYAKLGEKKFWAWRWDQRCWTYLRSWALNTGHIFLLPVFAVGQAGTARWPLRVALAVVGVLYLLLLPGLDFFHDFLPDVAFWQEPVQVMYARVPWLVATPMVLLALGLARDEGRRARLIAGLLVFAVFFFAVYSGGDWMRGYRWMALCAVPLSVLLADAAQTVSRALVPRFARLQDLGVNGLAFGLALPVLLPNFGLTVDVLTHVDTSPFDVRRRVLFTQAVRDRLHIDFVRNTEVDMGANVYFSGFEMVDLAGLCNVPIARHHYPIWFVDSFFRNERTPTFAHIHGSWANKTKVYRRSWFRRDYIEIPGFTQSFSHWMHNGNYVRRDLFIEPKWTPGPRAMVFEGQLSLDDLRTPADTVHPGGILDVELGWSVRRVPPNFRAVLILHREGRVVVRDLPPAYDWLPVSQWRTSHTMVLRHAVPLPDDLPLGDWDLGIAVYTVGEQGEVLAAAEPASDPVFVPGEARWGGVIRVEDRTNVVERATVELGRAVRAARSEDCDGADAHWAVARRYLAADDPWQVTARPAADLVRARCRARLARRELDVGALKTARQLAHRDPVVRQISAELAQIWMDEGDREAAAGDDRAAWEGWAKVMVADPTRSGLRRQLETLRPAVFDKGSRRGGAR